jgi:putative spermidine/putrescine transport system substrate-binding protein
VRLKRYATVVAVASSVVLLASACSSSSGGGGGSGASGGATPPAMTAYAGPIGQGEGTLNVLAWPGYAEDGSNYGPKYDWVTPFEAQTGCQVNVKTFGTSDESFKLMQTGQYDVVSASGDASRRLIFGGYVQPVNTDLVTTYPDIYPDLKLQTYNSVNGVPYGIAHGRGANILGYLSDTVKPAPTSWGAVFDANSPYKGKITAYDNPIYIADAALYLMNTQPDLGIKDPYALTQDQLSAAVDLLKTQKTIIGEYWTDVTKEMASFTSGNTVMGTTWQYALNNIGSKTPLQGIVPPSEGATGWSDTWMVGANTQHINCAYDWLNWITSAKVQAQVAQFFGEAPANSKACNYTAPGFCQDYHAADAGYWKNIWFWNTPTTDCIDGSGTDCTDYNAWVQAWAEVRAS